jgi:hypothetical protein
VDHHEAYIELDRCRSRLCTMPFINVGRLRDKMLVAYKRAINIGSDGCPSRDNYPDPASRVRHVSN